MLYVLGTAVYMVEWAECFQASRANVAMIASINTAIITVAGTYSYSDIYYYDISEREIRSEKSRDSI
jgi:hypothetical protein